jgi:AbrB family looped-hinge helix DNA binding protein
MLNSDYDGLSDYLKIRSTVMKTATNTCKIGQRGVVVIPARLRKRAGLKEGDLVIVEQNEDGILIRPAVAVPLEIYSSERKAEFLLNNASTAKEYRTARRQVKQMGLDPDQVPHKPPGE